MRVFCDLDDVLTDFEGGVRHLIGTSAKNAQTRHLWRTLVSVPNFFETLPWRHDGWMLWQFLSLTSPIIITGCPVTYPHVEFQKRRWCARELGGAIEVICCPSQHKFSFCQQGDVLIDDKSSAKVSWIASGGVFIHHKSAIRTIVALKAILKQASSMNPKSSVEVVGQRLSTRADRPLSSCPNENINCQPIEQATSIILPFKTIRRVRFSVAEGGGLNDQENNNKHLATPTSKVSGDIRLPSLCGICGSYAHQCNCPIEASIEFMGEENCFEKSDHGERSLEHDLDAITTAQAATQTPNEMQEVKQEGPVEEQKAEAPSAIDSLECFQKVVEVLVKLLTHSGTSESILSLVGCQSEYRRLFPTDREVTMITKWFAAKFLRWDIPLYEAGHDTSLWIVPEEKEEIKEMRNTTENSGNSSCYYPTATIHTANGEDNISKNMTEQSSQHTDAKSTEGDTQNREDWLYCAQRWMRLVYLNYALSYPNPSSTSTGTHLQSWTCLTEESVADYIESCACHPPPPVEHTRKHRRGHNLDDIKMYSVVASTTKEGVRAGKQERERNSSIESNTNTEATDGSRKENNKEMSGPSTLAKSSAVLPSSLTLFSSSSSSSEVAFYAAPRVIKEGCCTDIKSTSFSSMEAASDEEEKHSMNYKVPGYPWVFQSHKHLTAFDKTLQWLHKVCNEMSSIKNNHNNHNRCSGLPATPHLLGEIGRLLSEVVNGHEVFVDITRTLTNITSSTRTTTSSTTYDHTNKVLQTDGLSQQMEMKKSSAEAAETAWQEVTTRYVLSKSAADEKINRKRSCPYIDDGADNSTPTSSHTPLKNGTMRKQVKINSVRATTPPPQTTTKNKSNKQVNSNNNKKSSGNNSKAFARAAQRIANSTNRGKCALELAGLSLLWTDEDIQSVSEEFREAKLWQFYPLWLVGRGLCIIIEVLEREAYSLRKSYPRLSALGYELCAQLCLLLLLPQRLYPQIIKKVHEQVSTHNRTTDDDVPSSTPSPSSAFISVSHGFFVLRGLRGHCWERLLVDMGHLEKPNAAIERMWERAMDDPDVPAEAQLSLWKRRKALQRAKERSRQVSIRMFNHTIRQKTEKNSWWVPSSCLTATTQRNLELKNMMATNRRVKKIEKREGEYSNTLTGKRRTLRTSKCDDYDDIENTISSYDDMVSSYEDSRDSISSYEDSSSVDDEYHDNNEDDEECTPVRLSSCIADVNTNSKTSTATAAGAGINVVASSSVNNGDKTRMEGRMVSANGRKGSDGIFVRFSYGNRRVPIALQSPSSASSCANISTSRFRRLQFQLTSSKDSSIHCMAARVSLTTPQQHTKEDEMITKPPVAQEDRSYRSCDKLQKNSRQDTIFVPSNSVECTPITLAAAADPITFSTVTVASEPATRAAVSEVLPRISVNTDWDGCIDWAAYLPNASLSSCRRLSLLQSSAIVTTTDASCQRPRDASVNAPAYVTSTTKACSPQQPPAAHYNRRLPTHLNDKPILTTGKRAFICDSEEFRGGGIVDERARKFVSVAVDDGDGVHMREVLRTKKKVALETRVTDFVASLPCKPQATSFVSEDVAGDVLETVSMSVGGVDDNAANRSNRGFDVVTSASTPMGSNSVCVEVLAMVHYLKAISLGKQIHQFPLKNSSCCRSGFDCNGPRVATTEGDVIVGNKEELFRDSSLRLHQSCHEENSRMGSTGKIAVAADVDIDMCLLSTNEFSSTDDECGRRRKGCVVGRAVRGRNEMWLGAFSEAKIWVPLLVLLMWDEIFDDSLPLSFPRRFLTKPLDFLPGLYSDMPGTCCKLPMSVCDAFYTRRRDKINRRVAALSVMAKEALGMEVLRSYAQHEDARCYGLNWEAVCPNELASFAQCVGGKRLSLIFNRMLRYPATYYRGMPDLLFWRLRKRSDSMTPKLANSKLSPAISSQAARTLVDNHLSKDDFIEAVPRERLHPRREIPKATDRSETVGKGLMSCETSKTEYHTDDGTVYPIDDDVEGYCLPEDDDVEGCCLPEDGDVFAVEVKSEHDRLSVWQTLWLQLLQSVGVHAEVMKVLEEEKR